MSHFADPSCEVVEDFKSCLSTGDIVGLAVRFPFLREIVCMFSGHSNRDLVRVGGGVHFPSSAIIASSPYHREFWRWRLKKSIETTGR